MNSIVTQKKRSCVRNPSRKLQRSLGQFFTPPATAQFMAELFPAISDQHVVLLEPGAGHGFLTKTFIENILCNDYPASLSVDAFEIDGLCIDALNSTLNSCKKQVKQSGIEAQFSVRHCDFLMYGAETIASTDCFWQENSRQYTHCIMNPPYKKIQSASPHRQCARTAGFETVNLYSAFIGMALRLLTSGGYLVAIVPRSFCNGLYYRPFREFLLKHSAIHHIHLFDSRSSVFRGDSVLQENVIISLEKNGKQGDIAVSTSTDDSFSDLQTKTFPFSQIILSDDTEKYIRIPTSEPHRNIVDHIMANNTLAELGINVSTGPVVDFRVKNHLRYSYENGTIPLLYPCHFKNGVVAWNPDQSKKPCAICINDDTSKWMFPNGCYAVTRRFSAKEEKRRIVASILTPELFRDAPFIAFENHLNVFHCSRLPLEEDLAFGLVWYMNSTMCDTSFRSFSGHTQVNATDLRLLKYPSRNFLTQLGKSVKQIKNPTQELIDTELSRAYFITV
ncbi:MAG: Eco57I restriction-modification methylase domain-containing protein [Thermoguttaceae bacterium]